MGFLQDYLYFVCFVAFIAFVRVAIYQFTTPITKYGEKKLEYDKPADEDVVEKVKKHYNLDVEPRREKEVKIKSIWLYPVRGIRGMKVDHCEITPYGLKQDRNWVTISVKTMRPLANHNSHVITYLRQNFVKDSSKLRLYLQDKLCFPDMTVREQFLDFDADYSNAEMVECMDNYRGYKESDSVNQWLSQIFDEEVFVIRA